MDLKILFDLSFVILSCLNETNCGFLMDVCFS